MIHNMNIILRRSQQRFRWSVAALQSLRRLLVVECDGANIDRQRGMLVGRHQGVHGLTPDPQEGRLPLPVALPLLLAGADGERRSPARVTVGEGPEPRGLLDDVIVLGVAVPHVDHPATFPGWVHGGAITQKVHLKTRVADPDQTGIKSVPRIQI